MKDQNRGGWSGDGKTLVGPSIKRIVSGGQTGADRAALDFAIKRGFPHAGWCPARRMAEDGPIGLWYQLKETPSNSYSQCTEWNVRDSDGTVIFTIKDRLKGGSRKTMRFAKELGKPWIHLTLLFRRNELHSRRQSKRKGTRPTFNEIQERGSVRCCHKKCLS